MNALQFPPFLKRGDKVLILSPSGKIDKTFLKGGQNRLESWGLKVELAKHAGASSGRFAGTEKQRTEDFQKALDDEEIRLIFCSRGGYGAVHLLDKLDFTLFRQNPKWLVGYSDITALHQLFQYNGYTSIHGPMGRHLTVEAAGDPSSITLKEMLFGRLNPLECLPHKLNREGTARGILRGGNLSVFYGLRGTRYDIPPEGTILFLEDVGERPYHIDRMMNNLKIGGILERISGLIVGQFTEYEEDKLMKKEVLERISDLVKEYDYPVCYDFPVGHGKENFPLICGAEAELNVTKKVTKLKTFGPSRTLFSKE